MSRTHPTIFLGDLVRAIEELQPSDEVTREAIVDLLGITTMEESSWEDSISTPPSTISSQTLPINTPTPEKEFPSLPAATTVPSILEKEALLDFPAPLLISPLPEETPDMEEDIIPEPLFRRDWQRGILSTALAVHSEDGPVNIDEIIQKLARFEPVKRLPRQLKPTLRYGIQLLIDYSEALVPFRADQLELVHAIIRLVGPDKTQILGFEESPLRLTLTGLNADWEDYRPPPKGTPVVLLTDLGIARPLFSSRRAAPKEWFVFVNMLYQAGCSVTAFVPYAANRWPPSLAQVMKIIPWDRKTTLNTIHNLLRQNKG